LISGDLAHFGQKFGDPQAASTMFDEVKHFDSRFMDYGAANDPTSILKLVQEEMDAYRICGFPRSEEHTSELQSRFDLVCRLMHHLPIYPLSLPVALPIFLISGDLAHFGQKFGDPQAASTMFDEVKHFDSRFMDYGAANDPTSILKLVQEEMDAYRICGFP